MEYIIGIDIGTGSTKAVALNLAYEPFDSCQKHYESFSSAPEYNEQDPETIWKAFIWCINRLTDKLGDPVAIGLSSAMHSLIAVDKKGSVLIPMMTWADSRSADIASEIRASDIGMQIYKATGTPIHAMSPLCKVIWLHKNRPTVFNNTHKFISIKEYIWFRLFREYKIDHSIASCTGFFDIEKFVWHKDALRRANISSAFLSEPVSTSYTKRCSELVGPRPISGLKNTIFVIGASDGCLANLGSNACGPGIAAVTIGTSGAVRVANNKPVYNEKAMTFSYLLDEQTYICGGPINNGGIALQWLLKNIFGKEELSAMVYDELFEQLIPQEAGSEGLIFLPYLTGERAPIWDSQSCGTFFGLKLHHKQAHIAHAVLEGICYALKDVMDAVEQYTGNIKQLNVSGGFVHSKLWMQILADVTGKDVMLVQSEDASAIGAALMAIKALGLELKADHAVYQAETITPDLNKHKKYSKCFLVYKQLYANLKDIMPLLDDA